MCPPSAPQTDDTTSIDDTRIARVRPLLTPALLEEELPLTANHRRLVADSRAAIARLLKGEDDRLMVVVGPCSVHDPAQAIDYAQRLQAAAADHDKNLLS